MYKIENKQTVQRIAVLKTKARKTCDLNQTSVDLFNQSSLVSFFCFNIFMGLIFPSLKPQRFRPTCESLGKRLEPTDQLKTSNPSLFSQKMISTVQLADRYEIWMKK